MAFTEDGHPVGLYVSGASFAVTGLDSAWCSCVWSWMSFFVVGLDPMILLSIIAGETLRGRPCSDIMFGGLATDASELAGLELLRLKLAPEIDLSEPGCVEEASSVVFVLGVIFLLFDRLGMILSGLRSFLNSRVKALLACSNGRTGLFEASLSEFVRSMSFKKAARL
jgi:hypothetical protein